MRSRTAVLPGTAFLFAKMRVSPYNGFMRTVSAAFKRGLLGAILGILIVVGAVLTFTHKEEDASPVACTMEARMCPDGTFVGRTGPKCEFQTCPVQKDYRSAVYEIDGISTTLTDGYAVREVTPDSATKVTTRVFGNEAYGDLNGDGADDVAFILTQDTGGSGTFFYVAAALHTDIGFYGTNALLLGDRIAPQSTEIHDGIITVNYAVRKEGEPMTAQPSVGITRTFRIINDRLSEVR